MAHGSVLIKDLIIKDSANKNKVVIFHPEVSGDQAGELNARDRLTKLNNPFKVVLFLTMDTSEILVQIYTKDLRLRRCLSLCIH